MKAIRLAAGQVLRSVWHHGGLVAFARQLAGRRGVILRYHSVTDDQAKMLAYLDSGLMEAPPERLYDNRQLARAAVTSTAIKCECPHHLADLILSLCHFEAYSARCESLNRDDAALHAYLHVTTAQARSLMEQALQKVVEVEGIDLDEWPSEAT